MKTLAIALATFLGLSSTAFAAGSLMSEINGKRMTLVSMTGVNSKNYATRTPFIAECPNGQAEEVFKFQGLYANGKTAAIAYEPACDRLSFNMVAFMPQNGREATIGLGLGEGRPIFSFQVQDQALVDVTCSKKVDKGWVWNDVTLTCKDKLNANTTFVFKVH